MLKRIKYFGKKPLCNLQECRAPKFKNFVFPLCYRCIGLIIGGVVSYFLNTTITISLMLALPFLIDVTLQYFNIFKSTNLRRFVTGILFGLSLNIFN